jgi:hypothetical protein
MSWGAQLVATYGFNFRQSSGFVTDGANDTYVTAGDNYPVTRNGITFGWSVALGQDRDRNSGVDARLAGVSYPDSGGTATFRVDLPATGTYLVTLALGDEAFANGSGAAVTVKDNATDVITLTGLTPGAAEFYDATGVKRTSVADWVSNNAASSETFASTTLLVVLNPGSAVATTTPIAHLSITDAAGGGAVIPVFMNQYRQRRA